MLHDLLLVTDVYSDMLHDLLLVTDVYSDILLFNHVTSVR
jgi:hypothetical protein